MYMYMYNSPNLRALAVCYLYIIRIVLHACERHCSHAPKMYIASINMHFQFAK